MQGEWPRDPAQRVSSAVDTKVQIFKVSDFLAWQRQGSLTLSPSFQRRSVWKIEAKSYLLDTISRGLPVPLIFIRERLDLETQTTVREVVDGQQRLRTLFGFIDPSSLHDFNEDRDGFGVLRKHNSDLSNTPFPKLSTAMKQAILGYEFGTYVLPPETEDRDVLKIFARINSTGVRLNGQELRNAEYFGDLKQVVYDLALEQLDRWRRWSVFTEENLARMLEVEFVSDVTLTMVSGEIVGKTQKRLDNLYERYDDSFPNAGAISSRFRRVLDTIDESVGDTIRQTVFSSEVLFYSLWVLVYDLHYGLDSELTGSRKARRVLNSRLRSAVVTASERIREEDVFDDVLDAIRRASADTGRRETRHQFLVECYAEAN